MQIKSLEYYDNEYKWQLAAVEFLPTLNLLVGVSGVGKTRILDAIQSLKFIANGASLNGVQWNVCFIADDNLEYIWSGKFETKEESFLLSETSDKDSQPKIIAEKLTHGNGDILIERKNPEIFFNGNKTPKLSPFLSVLELLEQEDEIAPIKGSIDKIAITDPGDIGSIDRRWRREWFVSEELEKAWLSTLLKSGLPVQLKLAILYRTLPREFNKIKEAFITVFPKVLDIRIEMVEEREESDIMTISLKEEDVEGWIQNISSGMLKTLIYISELYLAPDKSVILIDEFENSLGINCLDSVTELILNDRNIQFFITSHHPYIINNISPAYWKIVTRKAGLVTVKSSEDFHIPGSRQKAFIELLNILEDEEESEE